MSPATIAAWCAAAALVLVLGQSAAACGPAQEVHGCRTRAACATGIRLTVADGLVSLETREAPVGAIVAAIATRASLVVAAGDALEDTLTDSFAEVPLGTALARILGDRSFLLQTQAPNASGRRGWLWIIGGCIPATAVADAAATTQWDASTVDYESMSSNEVLMSLANTLASSDAPARRNAIHELGALPTAAALPLLRQGLGDPDRAVRVTAVRELAALGPPAAATLVAALDDRDTAISLRALDALAEIATPPARASLQQALGHPNARVREAAAEHLADLNAAGR